MNDINIKKSLCFDDLLMLPNISEIKSRSEIKLNSNIGNEKEGRSLELKIPLISAPMDTVTGEKMAIKIALEGGLGIIHRFMPFNDQLMAVKNVKRYINYIFTKPYKMKLTDSYNDLSLKYNVKTFIIEDDNGNFEGLITNRDYQCSKDKKLKYTKYDSLHKLYYTKKSFDIILKNSNSKKFKNFMIHCRDLMNEYNIEKCPIFECYLNIDDYSYYGDNITYTNKLLGLVTKKSIEHYFNNSKLACLDNQGRLCVGAAVGIRGDYLDRIKELVNVGLDCICVDVANGHNIYTINAVKEIRKHYPKLIIMSGNVCNKEGYIKLAQAGSDIVRVGIGNGSICSTRLETGIGYGQWSAVNECYQAKQELNLNCKILCDGGSLGKTGNKVKALAIGADAIMLGRTLGGTLESPGTIIIRNGKRMKYFRGMASTMANLSGQESKLSSGENTCKKSKLNTNFTAEGVDGMVDIKGSVSDILSQITGGIRSGLSYLGAYNLEDLNNLRLNNEITWVQSTSIGLNETKTRIKTL
jgi:IMP dehydrogenase